jgi:hypothetical protein
VQRSSPETAIELRPYFNPAISELVKDGLADRVSLDNGEAYRGVRND